PTVKPSSCIWLCAVAAPKIVNMVKSFLFILWIICKYTNVNEYILYLCCNLQYYNYFLLSSPNNNLLRKVRKKVTEGNSTKLTVCLTKAISIFESLSLAAVCEANDNKS